MIGAIVLQLAIVAVGAVALAVILRRLRGRLPRRGLSQFELAIGDRREPEPEIYELRSIQRAFDGARLSSFDVHAGLRPLLHNVAASRLWERRGIELDRQPGPASRVLGPETLAVLREGRPAGRAYRGPGLTLAALERIVRSLESI